MVRRRVGVRARRPAGLIVCERERGEREGAWSCVDWGGGRGREAGDQWWRVGGLARGRRLRWGGKRLWEGVR